MYCPKCGFENPDEARFCGKCASPMPGAPTPPAPGGIGPPRVPATAAVVSPGLKLGIGIASVLIPLIGLIMGIIYLADANHEKKSAGKLWLILAVCGILMYCAFSGAFRDL
jgi:zinc-ribbon domain